MLFRSLRVHECRERVGEDLRLLRRIRETHRVIGIIQRAAEIPPRCFGERAPRVSRRADDGRGLLLVERLSDVTVVDWRDA